LGHCGAAAQNQDRQNACHECLYNQTLNVQVFLLLDIDERRSSVQAGTGRQITHAPKIFVVAYCVEMLASGFGLARRCAQLVA
jgi:hypothetical protein